MIGFTLALLAFCPAAQTPTCTPALLPTFGGVDGEAIAAVTFDDGSGPKLYVGGNFATAGGISASRIAAWNGSTWSALGPGLNDSVKCMVVFNDGTGPALYVGGKFTATNGSGLPLGRIARWDGNTWSALGSGLNGVVEALAVFNDGTGEALYAGGDFSAAGATSAIGVAKWNGLGWSSLGSGLGIGPGLNGTAFALTVHNDGAGSALFVGGFFKTAGGVPAKSLARWSGSAWQPVGSGTDRTVYSLASFRKGSTPALYVGGDFGEIGGLFASDLVTWDGSSFSPAVPGDPLSAVTGIVGGMRVFDDGSGEALYVGMNIGSINLQGSEGSLARSDGTVWSIPPGAPEERVRALAAYPTGPGARLHAVGAFDTAGGLPALGIARLEAAGWEPLADGGLNGGVYVIRTFDDGNGPAVYVGGAFTAIGGQAIAHLARWKDGQWSAVGAPVDGPVWDLAVLDSGGGPALHVAGDFAQVGAVTARGLARWDGSTWSAFGSGFTYQEHPSIPAKTGGVHALATFDNGSGSALYAGGRFTTAGGTPIRAVARWDGSSWTAVGGGLPNQLTAVNSLVVANLPGGPALVAGGNTSPLIAGPGPVLAHAGSGWQGLGAPLTSSIGFGTFVTKLLVFDSGSGPRLHASGLFDSAGPQAVSGVARFNGTQWEPVAAGLPGVVGALTAFDDGFGPRLYASTFNTTDQYGVARLIGTTWTPVVSGLNNGVGAIAPDIDLTGPALLIGGIFTASPSQDAYLVRWKACGTAGLSVLPGCVAHDTKLQALSPGLLQGQTAAFRSTAALGDGVALLFVGLDGTNASGCGLLLPGLGEWLLSTGGSSIQLGTAATSNGAATFQVPVPSTPTLLGKEFALQSAHVLLSLPGAPVSLSNGLLGRVLP
jgi:hypothetical protein